MADVPYRPIRVYVCKSLDRNLASSTEIVDEDERGVGYRGDGTRRAAGWNVVRAAGGAGHASGPQRANLLPLPTGQSMSLIQARLGPFNKQTILLLRYPTVR